MSITVEQIISADGFAADRDGGIDFFGYVNFEDDDRTDVEQMAFLQDIDRIALGRRTFEMFSGYWPTADEGTEAVAGPINALPKTVLTNSVDELHWGDGSRATDLEIARSVQDILARSDAGERIVVWGSLTLCRALFAAGAVDRLRLRIVPTVLGDGLGFTQAIGTTPMRLLSTQAHGSGHVTVDYGIEPR